MSSASRFRSPRVRVSNVRLCNSRFENRRARLITESGSRGSLEIQQVTREYLSLVQLRSDPGPDEKGGQKDELVLAVLASSSAEPAILQRSDAQSCVAVIGFAGCPELVLTIAM